MKILISYGFAAAALISIFFILQLLVGMEYAAATAAAIICGVVYKKIQALPKPKYSKY